MIKIGVLGCGRISQRHLEAIAAQTGAECIAVCDIAAERARQAAYKYHIPCWTTDYNEILANRDIDLISLCTPSGLHPEQGIAAARCGKHVLSEKPMAVSLQDADKLINACCRAGVCLWVVFQNRFNPAVKLLRRAFEEGRFGRLYLIAANVYWQRSQNYYDMAAWRGTRALDGGAFMNQASHYLDMLQWFGGPVQSVQSLTATLARKIEMEDTGSAIIRFRNAALGSINVTMLSYPENMEGSLTIIGEHGSVKLGGTALNKIEYWRFRERRNYENSTNPDHVTGDPIYGNGHNEYYKRIIEYLSSMPEKRKQTGYGLIDGLEGRKSMAILDKIYGNAAEAVKLGGFS